MFTRILTLSDSKEDTVFLWGARQTGKSTLLKKLFPEAIYYDLLKSDDFERFSRRASLLSEELSEISSEKIVIIDEVQKIPQLLDEVQWLIVNKGIRFILCGSSARKLKRSGANLLGGRAIRNVLYPLVSAEIPDFDIHKAINNGMIPRHYLVENPVKRLQAYVGDYLQQEIQAEALVRNISSFSRFLEIAALSSGEMINYQNIASECGISAPTAREYFSILEDTLIGYTIPAYTKTIKRRLILAPKFYFFDLGIPTYLLTRKKIEQGPNDFGKAFEHLIIQELIAYLGYTNNDSKLTYWRTSSQFEVDCIIGDAKVAIEIKSTSEVHPHHCKGIKAFKEEHPNARAIIVSFDKNPRKMGNIEIIPAIEFLKMLWEHRIIVTGEA